MRGWEQNFVRHALNLFGKRLGDVAEDALIPLSKNSTVSFCASEDEIV
jgi:hypothetical protein